MRVVPQSITDAWKSEDKTGNRRPIVRATVQKVHLKRFEYDTARAAGDFDTQRQRKGFFTSIIMGDDNGNTEIRNIKNYNWTRSVNQDVAECTITIKNTELTPIGNQEEMSQADDFDLPGYMTYNRGEVTKGVNRWGFNNETGWNGKLVPDRLVRTYEGYGCDPSVPPGQDPNLVISGTWLIDSAEYTSEGDITLNMRDVGSLLLKQICFPPVIPYGEYPLEFIHIHNDQVEMRDAKGGNWLSLKGNATATSSNDKYIGKGLTNDPKPHYVTSNGGVEGHHAQHALENGDDGYWLSTGQDSYKDKVWWEATFNDPTTAMAAIRIHCKGGPYKVYVSLHNGDRWLGRKKIPYDIGVGDVDINADIPFVMQIRPERALPEEFVLKRKYGSIKKMRLTFTNLRDSNVGEHPFWAGLMDVHIYRAANVADLYFGKGTVMKQVGNYRDYTDIVKWACAWGGFYWPPHDTGKDFIVFGEDQKTWFTQASPDPRLPSGRVWGDFMNSGTAGLSPGGDLTPDLFDKKPLMDVINYVRDVLGFIFFIDESGGVVWRMPNLGYAGNPKLGNYLSPAMNAARNTRSRTDQIITIDERETLLRYTTRLSSESIRERIFVADTVGKTGVVIKGFNPYPQGFRRVAGWTDQHFESKKETRVMADMIAAAQMFSYRRSNVTIAGNPAIQIDDQVRVFERVTNETFYQYVETISSSLDMEEGKWTYDLETHWLGEDPSDAWVVKVTELDTVTQAYINASDGA